ncbi:primosomal protein [Janibacter sp. G56]|uniref:primosomal protein n=1 Tax=Janibacter sp. G56 TaxID=3418717 RepID=UPI003D03FB98
MSVDPRAALNTLVAAFERHLEASAGRHGEDDPAVLAAWDDLADAFEAYDDALLDAYGEMTPLEVYTAPEENADLDEDDDDLEEFDDDFDDDDDDDLDDDDDDEDSDEDAPARG